MLRRSWKLALFIGVVVFVPYLMMAIGMKYDPYLIKTSKAYLAPNWLCIFGTDGLGRDMFARTFYAAGLSLKVVFQSIILSFFISLIMGGIAGYAHGYWIDKIISWIISLLYTIPFILIIIAVFAVVEPNIERAYIVIGCIGWAGPARLVRAEVIQLRNSPFIIAERAFGFSEIYIFLRSILPLSFLPALISLLYYIPELISVEVGLSFFGLGAQPPTPSLGRLIYEGLSEFYTAWWLTLIPAIVLLLLTYFMYILSDLLSKR